MSQGNLPLLLQLLVHIIAKKVIPRISAITNILSEQVKVFKNGLKLRLLISNLVILDSQDSTKITPRNMDKILGTADGLYELSKFFPI